MSHNINLLSSHFTINRKVNCAPEDLWQRQALIVAPHCGLGGSRGLVVKVLDSKFEGCEFKTHTGHGSFSKLRQFRLPYFASVYSAANEYKHCLEGTCDGLVSRPGESV